METVTNSELIDNEVWVVAVALAAFSGLILFKKLEISKQVLRTAREVYPVHVQLPDVHVKDTFW